MKRILNLCVCLALLLASAPMVSKGTVFFTDNFDTGNDSTNLASIPGGTTTASYTSYDFTGNKDTGTNSLVYNTSGTNCLTGIVNKGFMHVGLNSATTSGWWEYQARFATNGGAFNITTNGDYIEYSVTFTNYGLLLVNPAAGTGSLIWIGLYNSGGTLPLQGDISSGGLTGSGFGTGNCENWAGYVSQIGSNANVGATASCIFTRPMQNGPTAIASHQDLVVFPSNTGSFKDPIGTQYLVTPPPYPVNIVSNGVYTILERITLISNACVEISNAVLDVNSGNAIIFSQATTNILGAGFLSSTFDGMAFGAINKNSLNCHVDCDISKVLIQGVSTPYNNYPHIDVQPISATVPTGGSCVFSATASGVGVLYQWRRNGTNLLDGGNIYGSSGSMASGTSISLLVSNASLADQFASGPNGYYCVFSNLTSNLGWLSTNSVTNSLTIAAGHNLIWGAGISGSGIWDLNTHASWNNSTALFNYGDVVTFDDTGAGSQNVVLAGSYLSAASVTMSYGSSTHYVLQGSGDFAGAGSLIYKGSAPGNCGPLEIDNANDYTGGTIISNASAWLLLYNYGALGSGPVYLDKAGGSMDIHPAANAGVGIQGDIYVLDNFLVTTYAAGSYGASFLGDLYGTLGKTLTINDVAGTDGTNVMVRLYGNNTVYPGRLNLADSRIIWAFYETESNSQVYNGEITGPGSVMQRDNGTTYLNYPNTYTGGTTPTTGTIAFGNATCLGTGPLLIAPIFPNLSGTGQVISSAGALTIANSLQYPSGTNNLTLLIGGTNALIFSSTGGFSLGGADQLGFGYTSTGTPAVPVTGTGYPTNRIFDVTNTALTTISAGISDGLPLTQGGFGLIKYGNSTLALTGTETYTGPTFVTNCGAVRTGALQIDGTISGSSVVTVESNGVLAGVGTISCPVTVTNGYIAGGDVSSIGNLHITGGSSTLTFYGGNVLARVNHAGLAADKISVGATIQAFGKCLLIVTNIGGPLTPGDTFQVFSGGVVGGTNFVVTGAGASWNNTLTSAGTISVASTNRAPMTTSLASSILTMQWPGYTGWILQSNSVGLLAHTNWVNVPNSVYAPSNRVSIDTTKTNVFYRLISQ